MVNEYPSQGAVEPLTQQAPTLRGPVLMNQRWQDVGFLHWFLPPAQVQRFMPPGVRPDLVPDGPWVGLSPVGLVPFKMVGAGLAGGPAIAYFGTFWETNVRLYSVDQTGRRGIVFLSLDANRLAVVLGARAAFKLRYRWAQLHGGERITAEGRELAWTARPWAPGHPLTSRIQLRIGSPLAPSASPAQERLAQFLTARWGLHTAHLGRTWYIPNEHEPWPLRHAEVLRLDDQLLASVGLPGISDRPPDHVLFAEGVRTRFGLPGLATKPRK